MPELTVHGLCLEGGTSGLDPYTWAPLRQYTPSCHCGWDGQTVASVVEAEAQYTEHVRTRPTS